MPFHRREAPDEGGEAFGCGHVGWGIAAMEVLNRCMFALAAPATSHPDGRLYFRAAVAWSTNSTSVGQTFLSVHS